MKHYWILVLVWALPMSAVQAAPVVVSKPKLVATNPDGPCDLTWAPDGHLVEVNPLDQRQELKWGWCFLAADGTAPDAKRVKDYRESPLRQLQQSEGIKSASVEVYSRDGRKNQPLQGTPWDVFGFDIDSLSYGWRFQDSRFSKDWREVSILARSTVYTWSSSTGKLLRRVRLTAPKSNYHDYSFASFSRDGSLVVAETETKPSGAALFDARSGRKIFTIPGSGTAGFWAGFLLENRFLVSQDFAPVGSRLGDQLMTSIWSVQQRRKLWSCPVSDYTLRHSRVRVLPRSGSVVVAAAKGIELRDMLTGQLQRTLPPPAEYMNDVEPSPDGKQIWASYDNGQIWSWRIG